VGHRNGQKAVFRIIIFLHMHSVSAPLSEDKNERVQVQDSANGKPDPHARMTNASFTILETLILFDMHANHCGHIFL
jgi:hypothetical protein